MRIPCQIDTYRRQKKCMKLVFTVDEKDCGQLAALLDLHMEKPLLLEIVNDTDKLRKQLLQITGEQRAKIFALIKDIAAYTGEDKESQRQQLTEMYCEEKEIEVFSLSDCMADTATDFINWLISFAFEQGVTLSENPADGLTDIEGYISMCVSRKTCCVCGKDANIVKWDDKNVIPLCDTHKQRAAKVGKTAFTNEFHVYGIPK